MYKTEEEIEEVISKYEYYENAGINGWKKAVIDLLPAKCSVAFRMKVEDFLNSVTSYE